MLTVPYGCEVIDGEIVEISTGEVAVIPTSCNCDVEGTCFYPPCQERLFAEMRYYGGARAPKQEFVVTNDEANTLLREFWAEEFIDAYTLHAQLAEIGDEAAAISPSQLNTFLKQVESGQRCHYCATEGTYGGYECCGGALGEDE